MPRAAGRRFHLRHEPGRPARRLDARPGTAARERACGRGFGAQFFMTPSARNAFEHPELAEMAFRLRDAGATDVSIGTMDRGFTTVEQHIDFLAEAREGAAAALSAPAIGRQRPTGAVARSRQRRCRCGSAADCLIEPDIRQALQPFLEEMIISIRARCEPTQRVGTADEGDVRLVVAVEIEAAGVGKGGRVEIAEREVEPDALALLQRHAVEIGIARDPANREDD